MKTTFALGLLAAGGLAGCAARTEPATAGARTAAHGSAGFDAPAVSCHLAGPLQTVASGVYVPAGVEASVEGEQVSIRFARRKGRCESVHALAVWSHFASDEGSAECPSQHRDVVATSEGETLLAKESRDDAGSPRIDLSVVVHDVPSLLFGFVGRDRSRVVERAFEPPEGGRVGGQRSPGLVSLPGERFLLMWVEGDSYGRQLRAQPVAGWGAAAGPVFDVSPPDASVIGAASAAMAKDGRGEVAFLASRGNGFDVLAAPIACVVR
jgi:hypothetical protein